MIMVAWTTGAQLGPYVLIAPIGAAAWARLEGSRHAAGSHHRTGLGSQGDAGRRKDSRGPYTPLPHSDDDAFEVEVFLNDLDRNAVRVELYADVRFPRSAGGDPFG